WIGWRAVRQGSRDDDVFQQDLPRRLGVGTECRRKGASRHLRHGSRALPLGDHDEIAQDDARIPTLGGRSLDAKDHIFRVRSPIEQDILAAYQCAPYAVAVTIAVDDQVVVTAPSHAALV